MAAISRSGSIDPVFTVPADATTQLASGLPLRPGGSLPPVATGLRGKHHRMERNGGFHGLFLALPQL